MKEITKEELEQLKSNGEKVLLDLHGVWCGPCKALMPRLESLQNEYPNIKFVKMDVDQNKDYALQMGIRSVPTIMIYNGETLVNRSVGANTDDVYKKILDTL